MGDFSVFASLVREARLLLASSDDGAEDIAQGWFLFLSVSLREKTRLSMTN